MNRHVYVRGEKIPVKRRRLRPSADGRAFKRTKSDKRHVNRRIELERNLRGVAKLSTLIHEMLHQLHIGLAERTILKLESGIVQMVGENPELFHELAHRTIEEGD